MADVKLNFLHVCENAFISQEGKLSVIGIFNQIRSDSAPVIYPKFSIVVGVGGKKGNYTEEIQIVSDDGNVIANIKKENVEIREDGGSTNFIANLAGFVFPKKGKYTIKVKIDEDNKGEAIIEII